MNSTVDQSPSLSSLGACVAIDPSIHQPADQKALRRKVYRNASDSLIVRGTFWRTTAQDHARHVVPGSRRGAAPAPRV